MRLHHKLAATASSGHFGSGQILFNMTHDGLHMIVDMLARVPGMHFKTPIAYDAVF